MPASVGANVYIGFGVESTWNTPVTRTRFVEPISVDLQAIVETGFSRVIRQLAPQRRFTIQKRSSGSFETEIMYEGYGLLFEHLLGSTASNNLGGSPSAYRHQIVRATSLPTGLTIEHEVDQDNMVFSGCKIASAELSFPTNDYPSASWSIAGGTATNGGTATSPTYPADLPALPSAAAISWGSTDLSQYIRSLSLTVTNELLENQGRYGSTVPLQPQRQNRTQTTWSMEVEHNDTTDDLMTDYLAGTQRKLKITYTGDVISGANSHVFKAETPLTAITSCTQPQNSVGVTTMSLEFTALQAAASDFDVNSSQAGELKITIQNKIATVATGA